MKVAIIGGGINGVMSAWALALRRHAVTLFEAGELMSGTSSRSTKLLHGGLRYLEHGQLQLVQSSLKEREWWMRTLRAAKRSRSFCPCMSSLVLDFS